MPSLNELLEHTMVFVAARGAGKAPTKGVPTFLKPFQPAKEKEYKDDEVAKNPIWHFVVDSDPSKVTAVTCIARGMGHGRMGVCDEIRFGAVKVTLPDGTSTDLKLESKFLFATYWVDGGKILGKPATRVCGPVLGASDLYPLEMNVDKAFVHAFVFEFSDGPQKPPKATKDSITQSSGFMPVPSIPGTVPRTSAGVDVKVAVDTFRVVVFASLVTCKEKADFDPGGALGGGRLIPHLMIMGNRPLKAVDASVKMVRPVNHTMEGGDHTLCADMNFPIESSIFADDNDAEMITLSGLQVPSPFWDDLFDAFESPAPVATYRVVRPEVAARTVTGAVEELNDNDFAHDPLLPLADAYESEDIQRLARQGAYDNIHTAPTMKTSAGTVKGVPQGILDKVYMAPFCEHDCLHTHWRWGAFTSEQQNLGWGAKGASVAALVPGVPNSEVGAPMVPLNQRIEIKVLSANSYEYVAHAESVTPIAAGTYTFVNHHGSAYAVAVASPAKFGGAKFFVRSAIATDGPEQILPGDYDSAAFYWHLRYALFEKVTGVFSSEHRAFQRLKMVDLKKIHEG